MPARVRFCHFRFGAPEIEETYNPTLEQGEGELARTVHCWKGDTGGGTLALHPAAAAAAPRKSPSARELSGMEEEEDGDEALGLR